MRKAVTTFHTCRRVLVVSGIVFCLFSSVFAYSGGTGEPNDPYQIATVSDWNNLMNTPADWNDCFILTADVNLQGVTLTPVGNYSNNFTGVFDDNDHIIRNADINMPNSNHIGLFGRIDPGGQIRNLGVEDVNIIGLFDVGGLVGENGGSINNCYSTGMVRGGYGVGGLVGLSEWDSINNCYSTGAVGEGGAKFLGGLVGYNYRGTITNCYAAGVVAGGDRAGGLVGSKYGGITNASFWDMNTSGQTTSAGGVGLTTSQMKSVTTYQNSGWADNGWVINDGVDYPHLAWENTGGIPIPPPQPPPLSGNGTEQDPYQIGTANDFALLSQYISVLDKHIALMADLDLSGITFYPIGYNMRAFTGVFDGNGHIIRNVNINMSSPNYIGLFASVGSNGQIRNLRIEDVNIIGSDDYVGGLAGRSDGNIINCYVTGTVSGRGTPYSNYIGGLVGENSGTITACYASGTIGGTFFVGGLTGWNAGDITDCYATGAVSGGDSVGGLVGENSGDINDCYVMGAVIQGSYYVGGLVGENSGTISACYATGGTTSEGDVCIGGLVGSNYSAITDCYATDSVTGGSGVGGLVGGTMGGTITSCYAISAVSGGGGLMGSNYQNRGIISASFWDVNTSGQTTSAGGEGKTTAEMQDINTFLNAGWDFSYTDGDPADWFIQIDEYPILTWQISPADIYTDGKNNFRDFAIFAQYWMRKDCAIYNYYCDWADLDFSGSVDIDDLIVLMSYWLQSGIYN